MALTSNGWWLNVTLVDGGGNKTQKRYELRSVSDADAATDSAAILAALGAVTDAVISKYSYGQEFWEDSFSFPAVTVQIENQASITGLLATGGDKKANFKIPAPVIGIFQAATGAAANVVDVTDGALNTYANVFQSDGEAFISDGEDLVEMVSGKRIHAKSTNG